MKQSHLSLISLSFGLSLILSLGACSSQPKSASHSGGGQESSEELQKATPVKAGKVKVYSQPTQAAEDSSTTTESESAVVEKRGCETPLGPLAHGESATGYLKEIIQPDEICISDTIRCKDGTWSGEAIHPTCKRADKK